MALFNHTIYTQALNLNNPSGTLDRLARWGIMFFAEGKFYATFAFLFGLGMALQYRRAQEHGIHFVPLFLRRMGVQYWGLGSSMPTCSGSGISSSCTPSLASHRCCYSATAGPGSC
jgi:hypothetical protein